MTQLHDPGTTVTLTIPVGRIVDGDNNRHDYPEDHIRSLAASILRDGQRDPLLVRPLDGGLFGLLSGHCRARAFHLLAEEHHAIDPRCVVVHPDSAEEADRIILDTNHHRQDPDEVETGEGYRRMIDRHGWTVERLGVEFGKSPRYVLNRLAVAKLGPLLRTAFLAKGFGLTVAQVIADAELTEAEQTGLWRLLQTCPAVTPEVTAELCDKFLAASDVQGGLFGGDWSEANILAAWELWLFFGLIWPVVLPLFAVMWLLKLTLGGMVTRCMLAGQRTARREAQKRSGTGTPTGDTR